MSNIFFDQLNIPRPVYNLGINQQSYSAMISKMVDGLCSIIIDKKIEGVIVYGDTNSTLAGSIAAKN